MGECLIASKQGGGTVATLGIDDTTKAAGHKTMDVKTGPLTLVKVALSRGMRNVDDVAD